MSVSVKTIINGRKVYLAYPTPKDKIREPIPDFLNYEQRRQKRLLIERLKGEKE